MSTVTNFTNILRRLLGENESYKIPSTLMTVLYDKERREQLFRDLLAEYSTDLSTDWFVDYFQEEHAERKTKKQDFTPSSVSKLCAEIVGHGNQYYEPTAGTGALAIAKWHNDQRSMFPWDYKPSEYLFTVEELSDRTIPFLLFNCAIRGMNAIVIHCDALTRETKGVFFVQNEEDDVLGFSSINVMPYTSDVEEFLNVKFTDFRYKPLVESNKWPKHLGGYIN